MNHFIVKLKAIEIFNLFPFFMKCINFFFALKKTTRITRSFLFNLHFYAAPNVLVAISTINPRICVAANTNIAPIT